MEPLFVADCSFIAHDSTQRAADLKAMCLLACKASIAEGIIELRFGKGDGALADAAQRQRRFALLQAESVIDIIVTRVREASQHRLGHLHKATKHARPSSHGSAMSDASAFAT